MLVFARRNLVPDLLLQPDSPSASERLLLLEGDWEAGVSKNFISLDTYIDASHFAHLDIEAERLATKIGAAAAPAESSHIGSVRPNFADINILRLRYEALRWLRIIAFWQNCPNDDVSAKIELYVSPRCDNEYVALWRAMSQTYGFTLRIHFIMRDDETVAPFSVPRNAWWRRALAWIFANRGVNRGAARTHEFSPAASDHRARVLFVGNPRILDDVCDAVLDRGAHAAWLYDRFAVGAWIERRASGIAWLTCDDEETAVDAFPQTLLRETVAYGDIDLGDVVETWYRRWRKRLAIAQARQWRRVGEHLASLRPTHVVVDEDATPLARITVAHASRLGIPSFVVQHGVCCIRFGFAPLAADLFCAWNEGTRRQLEAWGVARDRIVVTGAPAQQQVACKALRNRASPENRNSTSDAKHRIVLLATVPPRDDRPDAVEFHLTSRTYAAMLHIACAAVAELGDAELIVKPHPRAIQDPILTRTLKQFPTLRHRTIAKQSLAEVLAESDCVLSCASSAGVDAAAAGLPVIQLLPQGSGQVLPADWYGLAGSARLLVELRPLLQMALRRTSPTTNPSTPETTEKTTKKAAVRIVELLFDRSHDASQCIPDSHFGRLHAPAISEEAAHG
ncbi:MAG: hypothetical protein K8U03_15325 [Planctomycetia bacterium]|nr:hypothetical protein [Planctomycetia bacterium]